MRIYERSGQSHTESDRRCQSGAGRPTESRDLRSGRRRNNRLIPQCGTETGIVPIVAERSGNGIKQIG